MRYVADALVEDSDGPILSSERLEGGDWGLYMFPVCGLAVEVVES